MCCEQSPQQSAYSLPQGAKSMHFTQENPICHSRVWLHVTSLKTSFKAGFHSWTGYKKVAEQAPS